MAYCVECGHDVAATFCAACGAKQPDPKQQSTVTGVPANKVLSDSPIRQSLEATVDNFTTTVVDPSFIEPVVMVFSHGDVDSDGLVSRLQRMQTPGARGWRLVRVDMREQKRIVDVYAAQGSLTLDRSPVVFVNWKSQGFPLFGGVPSDGEVRDALVALFETLDTDPPNSSPPLSLEDEMKLAHRCKCGALVLPQAYQKPMCWNCGRTIVVVGCSDCSQWRIFDMRKPRAVSVQCDACKRNFHYSKEDIADYFREATVAQSHFSLSCPQCRATGLRLIWRQRRRPASVMPGTVIVTAYQGHYEYWKDAVCTSCSHSFQFTQKTFGHDWPE